jgi:hypothetical protein
MISQNFWRATRAAAEGIVVIAPLQSLNDPEIVRATDVLRKADVVPDLVALYSYAAVQVFAEAVRRAGGGESRKIVEVLRSGEFSTAVGRVAFDDKGDRRDLHYSVLTWEGGRLLEVQEIQQRAPAAAPDRGAAPAVTQQPARPAAQQPAPTASSDGVLRFDQPLPFGPTPVYGRTIKQLAESVPLFPPVEVQDEALWKRNCSTCHKWDQQTLCQQGASYVANPGNVLRHQHPFGGPYKVALMRWSKSGCR